MKIRQFQLSDEAAVIELWRQCGLIRPNNDPHKDIRRKMKVQSEMFLVGVIENKIVATVMAGYEGHRGWINYLAVDPSQQKNGIGRQIVVEAERLLRAAGCPKINLQVRTSNISVIEFYKRLGYAIDDVVSMGKRLEKDEMKNQPAIILLSGGLDSTTCLAIAKQEKFSPLYTMAFDYGQRHRYELVAAEKNSKIFGAA